MTFKIILKTSIFLLIFLNSNLLFGNDVQVKSFTFELADEAEVDAQLSAISIEDDFIWFNIDEIFIVTIDSLRNRTQFVTDTLIEFKKRDNLEIILLSSTNEKDDFYELFVKFKLTNQTIRFRGENLSEAGIAALLLIQKTIYYSDDYVEILSIEKDECDEHSYPDTFYQHQVDYQVIDINYESDLLTFKILKKSNCCEEASFTYNLKPHRRVPALLVTRIATYDPMYEECECDCLFCYTFKIKTKKEFKYIDFVFKENE